MVSHIGTMMQTTKSRQGTATQQEEGKHITNRVVQLGSPESQMMYSTSNFGSVANLKSKLSELEVAQIV